MKAWFSRFAAAWLVAALAFAAGCGSNDDSSGAVPAGSANVGGTGQTDTVTVTGVNGAQVIVPPGAIETPVTVRIGTDSSGAPPLPSGVAAAGEMYAVTPHGSRFAEPVQVRVPAPTAPLAANERYLLAKADPGGTWLVLGNTRSENGFLVADVGSFSFFVPIRVGYAVVPNQPPLVVTHTVNCGASSCSDLSGPATVTVNVASNGGALPQGCVPEFSTLQMEATPAYGRNTFGQRSTVGGLLSPATGGSFTQVLGPTRSAPGLVLQPLFTCSLPVGTYEQRFDASVLVWPGLPGRIEAVPVSIAAETLVAGGSADVTLIVAGGVTDLIENRNTPIVFVAPTPEARATIEWERSNDGGASWRFVATSYQNEGEAQPYGNAVEPWGYWRVRHRFASEAPSTGAIRFRARVCVDATVQSLQTGLIAVERRCNTSAVATATVIQQSSAPSFSTLPRSQLILAGQSASLTAVATGLPAATLQWQTRPANSNGAWTNVGSSNGPNNANVTTPFVPGFTPRLQSNGATSASYATPLLTLADNGVQYRVLATNAGGTAESPPVTISVSDQPVAPSITADLSNVRTVRGGDATFGVGVRGTEPLNFEWRVNGNVVIGENAPLITLQGVLGANSVSVTVSNAAGSVSSRTGSVTVFEGPIPDVPASIVLQPVATTVTAGNTATLAVKAEGSEPMAYQWRRNGQPVSGAPNAPIFTLPGAAAGDAGTYTVVVSNSRGPVTSAEAALTVNAAGAGGTPVAPSITVQPVGLTVNPGQTATLAVGASGSGTLGYQWAREGVPINGATTPVLTLSAVIAGDAGAYTVTVANAQGSVTSNAAALVVVAAPGAPIYTGQQFIVDAIVGDSPRILMRAEGTPAPQCLWLRNGVPLPGATDCTGLTVNNVTLADSGAVFTSVAYSSGGSVVGGPAVLNVQVGVAPTITLQPVGTSTTPGGLAQFSATASGTPIPSRQWLVDGVALPFATAGYSQGACTFGYDAFGANLTLINVSQGCDGRTFGLRATNSQGSVTSNAAVLTVGTPPPTNALTATQIVAGQEWSMVLRPDRTVWGWGSVHRTNGTVQYANQTVAPALRPVRMYPAVLSDVRAISGWFNSFWALKGEPGTTGSRVLHWGRAIAGNDGRGGDGNGSLGSSILPRDNEAAPVEVLERVNNVPQPVDRVCAIAGGGEQLAMIRAIDSAGATTDCNAGSAKTVWFVGSLLARGYDSTGVAFAMPGLPTNSPPAVIFTGQTTSGSPGLVIALEDGRLYGLGANPYGGFGVAASGSGIVGDLSGPLLLPSTWGNPRSFGMSFYYSLFVVRADGSVMTSGYDNTGELGLGSVVGGSTLGPLPVKAETCTGLPCADVLTGVTAIAGTQTGATLALKNGQILGWGARDSNDLRGPGVTANQPFPRSVPSTVSGFTALSASYAHALVIGPSNVVYAWGSGLRGALGDGSTSGTRSAPEMVTVP